ncbi:MobC family plasmid mobilization relaxosome protein (plasmid) [Escherichia coli]
MSRLPVPGGCRHWHRRYCVSWPPSGNNLNQTARKVNSGQWSSGDRVQVVAALMAIGDELRPAASGRQGTGDAG